MGSSVLHCGRALGQRLWKRHPDGGCNGLGTSPLRRMRAFAIPGWQTGWLTAAPAYTGIMGCVKSSSATMHSGSSTRTRANPHTPRADDAFDDREILAQPLNRQQGLCHNYPAFPSSTLRTSSSPHWIAWSMGVPVTALATMSGRMKESSMIWMNSFGLAGQPRGRPYWPS